MPGRTPIGALFIRGESLGDRIVKPFQSFAAIEASGGILMFLATVTALVWANSSWSDIYSHVFHLPVYIGLGETLIIRDVHFIINDGLMALFFFVVGLEIKRELLVGDLRSPRQAALPVAAAIGGVVVPALIYWILNVGGPAAKGWGIPMATDIAFVTAALTLLGRRAPAGMALFLVSLAIVDDICAVVVIAIFYSGEILLCYLLYAAPILGILAILNFLGFRSPIPYIIFGVILWTLICASGVHATVAGILIAFTIPCRSELDTHQFVDSADSIMGQFDRQEGRGFEMKLNENNQGVIRSLENLCLGVEPPLQRIEHALHPLVLFIIMPLFALANAGATINLNTLGNLLQAPESLGIILGLCVGKPLGITIFSWLAVKAGVARLPKNVNFTAVVGGGLLCGIGFTMSLFVADLSFDSREILETAKLSVLVASLLAGIGGTVILAVYSGNIKKEEW